MGRPTLYDPALCEQVVEYGRQGKSKTWMAAKIGVSRECLYEWDRVHPDFSDALKRAKALEQMWWEDSGQDGMTGDKFNGQVWGRSMSARFPDDWREKVAHVGGDKDDQPIKQEISLDADAFTRRILSANARATIDGGTGEPARTDEG